MAKLFATLYIGVTRSARFGQAESSGRDSSLRCAPLRM